jgi:hypothetical protein
VGRAPTAGALLNHIRSGEAPAHLILIDIGIQRESTAVRHCDRGAPGDHRVRGGGADKATSYCACGPRS